MVTKRATVALAAAGLLLAGCTRAGGDPADGGAGTPSAPPTSVAPVNAGSAGDEASSGGDVQCVLEAPGTNLLALQFRHDGEPTYYSFDVEMLTGDNVVSTLTVDVPAVQPGEAVREEALFTNSGTAPTRCRVAEVSTVAEEKDLVGGADVSACQNLRRGELESFTYELTFANPATSVPAFYAAYVAIRNPAGERRISRVIVAKGPDDGFSAVAPGESWTRTDTTISAPYREGDTCEVVAVDKYTDTEFFTDGATKGSLDADIGFTTGSAELTDDAKLLLTPAVEQIAGSTDVCVEGFADSVGADAANLTLSQARADAVAAFLTEAGVTATITSVGRGESEATADEVDDPALRRVDITLAICTA